MNVTITIDDPVSERLKNFGDAAPGMLDRSIYRTGSLYRTFVRRGYLSGQMLRRRSGKLQSSMRVQKERGRKHAYTISGQPRLSNIYNRGAVIRPRHKTVLRFMTLGAYQARWVFTKKPITLRPRPFIEVSARMFAFQTTFDQAAEAEIAAELKRLGID